MLVVSVEFAGVHPHADVGVVDVTLDFVVFRRNHESEDSGLGCEVDREQGFYEIEIPHVFVAPQFELLIHVVRVMRRDAGRALPSQGQLAQS